MRIRRVSERDPETMNGALQSIQLAKRLQDRPQTLSHSFNILRDFGFHPVLTFLVPGRHRCMLTSRTTKMQGLDIATATVMQGHVVPDRGLKARRA